MIAAPVLGCASWMLDGIFIGATRSRDMRNMMILSGLMADLAVTDVARWTWFAVGVACLLIIIKITWGTMRRVAYEQSEALGKAYVKVAAFLTVAWIGYPLIWALGPTGADVIGSGLSIPLLVLLPIASKVGFSVFDLYELRKLGAVRPGFMPSRSRHPSTAVPAE